MAENPNRAAVDAYNKILKFNFEGTLENVQQVPSSNRLYHYTASDGLKGIIEKSELWATSAFYLNDSAEISYGCGVVRETLMSWLDDHRDKKHYFGHQLGEHLYNAFGGDNSGRDIFEFGADPEIFLACFCEDDNLLSQWRAYGQTGGYSIGFDVPSFKMGEPPAMLPEPTAYTSKWAQIEYDKNRQLILCRKLLDGVLNHLFDDKASEAISAEGEHSRFGKTGFTRIITDILLEKVLAFKEKAFSVEREWRIIVRKRELVTRSDDDGGKTAIPIHFRSTRGMIVPYVKIIPHKKHYTKLPVVSVRTGPVLQKKTAAFAVKLLLKTNGYSNVDTRSSEITIRM
jgi:Protein of unknown function (DUF2971)